jgi:hypothetical protein
LRVGEGRGERGEGRGERGEGRGERVEGREEGEGEGETHVRRQYNFSPV